MTDLPLLQVRPVAVATSADRERLMRRARMLAWGANLWHVVEFAIAVGAGIAAGSIALIGFGLDSLVEVAAGTVIVWLFTGRRVADTDRAERRAQQLIAISFYLLGVYIAFEAGRDLIAGDHPEASWVGIGLAAVTAPTMPFLARAKQRIGHQLGSSATVSEGAQNMLCAYLSVALLIGLGANALFGLWWADPIAALVIAGVAVREGRQSWRGDACGCCTPASQVLVVESCQDDCTGAPMRPSAQPVGRSGTPM
jgi:divalent metal cation (Fe/Co/Zn/Cd) transporter